MRSLTVQAARRIAYMCGRYAQSLGAEEIVESFDLAGSTLDQSLPLNWNIAPTNDIYIIRNESESRILDSASWGIIAPWQKSLSEARASQSHAINARSESIHEKPTFRHAFRTSRCLIPATGYYEWATSTFYRWHLEFMAERKGAGNSKCSNHYSRSSRRTSNHT